jgi:hypothetical protein
MRHGDIAAFHPDLFATGGSPCILIEAKSGRDGSRARAQRQKEAADAISGYLRTDTRAVDGGFKRRVPVKEEPTHHCESATRMMKELPHGGSLIEEVEPGLYYALISVGCRASYDKVFRPLLSGNRPIFMICVNDMKKQHAGYYPFPLCLAPEALFRFYNDEFIMMVIVDLDVANASLAAEGLAISSHATEGHPWQVSAVGGELPWEGGAFGIGSHVIGRLAS